MANPHPGNLFQKGNTFGKGRPGKSKNQLEFIRRRILAVVKRRIFRERNLETVSTTDLLKFLAQIMPKEMGVGLHVQPQVNYISNVPRDQLTVSTIDTELTQDMNDRNNGTDDSALQQGAGETVLRDSLHPANDPGSQG